MTILAIETSTQQSSVALLVTRGENHADLLSQHMIVAHSLPEAEPASAHILTTIQKLLAQSSVSLADLSCIAFGAGPGAFTGLRTAASVAQGLAFALNIPVLAVNSLAAMAWADYLRRDYAYHAENGYVVTVAMDARMGQVYTASYQLPCSVKSGGLSSRDFETLFTTQAQLVDIDSFKQQLSEQAQDNPFSMQGGARAKCLISNHSELVQTVSHPSAGAIASIAQLEIAKAYWLRPEQALPEYVRNQVALTTEQRLAQQL